MLQSDPEGYRHAVRRVAAALCDTHRSTLLLPSSTGALLRSARTAPLSNSTHCAWAVSRSRLLRLTELRATGPCATAGGPGQAMVSFGGILADDADDLGNDLENRDELDQGVRDEPDARPGTEDEGEGHHWQEEDGACAFHDSLSSPGTGKAQRPTHERSISP